MLTAQQIHAFGDVDILDYPALVVSFWVFTVPYISRREGVSDILVTINVYILTALPGLLIRVGLDTYWPRVPSFLYGETWHEYYEFYELPVEYDRG